PPRVALLGATDVAAELALERRHRGLTAVGQRRRSKGRPAWTLLREPRTDARAEGAVEGAGRRVELRHRVGEQHELALEAACVDPERELHRPPRLAEAAPPPARPPRVVVGIHVDLTGGGRARRLLDDIDAALARAELLQRGDRERVR